MLLWVVLALMTGAAVMAVLWPLSTKATGALSGREDLGFYRHQLAEIGRDVERGLLSVGEAEGARTEAGRRLLRAQSTIDRSSPTTGEPALRRRRAASALTLSIVPLVGLAVYGALGSPHLLMKAPVQLSGAPEANLAGALAEIEAHLGRHPDDRRGWEVIAPIYLREGRFEDAGRAYSNLIRLAGDDAERLTGYGEALVGRGEGVVSADARDVFDRALKLDPQSPKARFYLALAAEQDGDPGRARDAYQSIVAAAPPDAPWLPVVRSRLAALTDRGKAVAGSGAVTERPEINVMVEGLDARLLAKGGSEPEWARLVRSYVVLGHLEKARDRLARAKVALQGEPEAGAHLDHLARDLGLSTQGDEQ